MDFYEKTLSSENIFNGDIINVCRDTVALPDGRQATREICKHCHGVAVLAVNSDNECALVTQYRYAFGSNMCELPAGKLDTDETDPEKAALRELREETGVIPKNILKLGEIYPSPGFCTEVLHLYIAYNLEMGQQDLDEDEFLNCEWIPAEDLRRRILNGEIKDAKTVAAFLLAEAKDWRKIVRE